MSLNQLLQMQFFIPFYQRNYTWEDEHALALLNDFCDAVQRASNNPQNRQAHYLANFVLMNRKDNNNHKDIIDGQQRLTTILILLKAIALEFKNKTGNSNAISHINSLLWPYGNNRKFILMSPANTNSNLPFLDKMLSGAQATPNNRAQENMWERFNFLRSHLNGKSDIFLNDLYKTILDSDLTDHYVNDIIEANRIFLTLNARGKPLTNFDKIKALLIYYAEKIGKQVLANDIHKAFAKISDHYESIDQVVKESNITLRSDGRLDEDILLGWHYCTIEQAFRLISASDVYTKLEANLTAAPNHIYIEDSVRKYIESAEHFFENLKLILDQVKNDPDYYESIAMCRFTGLVWPLIIVCNYRGFLNSEYKLENGKQIKILNLIKIIDKIHRRTRTQGQEIISLTYDVYNDSNYTIPMLGEALTKYHQNKWSTQGYTLGAKAAAKDDDYLNYLLFSCLIDKLNKNSTHKLENLKKENYRATMLLKSYLGVAIKKDHGYGSNPHFIQGTEETGNYVLMPSKCFFNIEDHESSHGKLSPVDLVNFLRTHKYTKLPQDTVDQINVISNTNTNSSINKKYIDDRTLIISQKLDDEWEI
ncbi:MAG: DUF262 domain-containing protein [Aquaspirillum sp.]